MSFVSNHDQNAREGAEFEHFGASVEAAVVGSVVGEGLPPIDGGQEAGNDRRVERRGEDNRGFAIVTFPPGAARARCRESRGYGTYGDPVTGDPVAVDQQSSFAIAPSRFGVLVDQAVAR